MSICPYCRLLFVLFTSRCIIVQSEVLRLHVVCLSVRLSVTLVDLPQRLEILETNYCTDN